MGTQDETSMQLKCCCTPRCIVIFLFILFECSGLVPCIVASASYKHNNIDASLPLLNIYWGEKGFGTHTKYVTVFGSLMFVITFFAGINKQYHWQDRRQCNRILDGVYTFFLLQMVLANLTLGLTSPVGTKFDEDLKSMLRRSLLSDYDDGHNVVADAWDEVQTKMECCGVDGPEDYSNATFHSKDTFVPSSCCKSTTNGISSPQPIDWGECQKEAGKIQYNQTTEDTYIHTTGCNNEMYRTLRGHFMAVFYTSMTMFVIQGICFWIVVWMLCNDPNRN